MAISKETQKKNIAFVCQRYGKEVNGGAEAECRMYAERLTTWYDVEVITTCAQDHVTWRNVYRPGIDTLNGVTIRRFRSNRERDLSVFGSASKKAECKKHSDAIEKRWLMAQGPYCPDLVSYLSKHGKDYAAVLFMTYLYYPTVVGIQKCNTNNCILIPTAHDEWSIYLRLFRKVFRRADKFIYNAAAEKRFVEKLFNFTVGKPSVTIGAGVEYPQGELPSIEEIFHIKDPYICYCGRIEPAKGCGTLFEYFIKYKAFHKESKLKLVLTGNAAMAIPDRKDIVALGFVSEEEKYAVMKNSVAFVLASEFESLSIVVLESMLMGRPVLVNGKSEVLKDHCIKSNAGFYFMNYREFEGELDYLLEHPEVYEQMRENGKQYVHDCYQWKSIMEKMRDLIEQ